MRYVDGFVVPVPENNIKLYKSIAQKAGKIWKEYGALEYIEAVGDDLENTWGASFTKAVKLKPGEVPFFSFIVYKSRAHRDKVNKQIMNDPRMKQMMDGKAMPFEVKRMVYGGFKILVDL
jgi:uncharacterized protein YbaA (DUF1428 family)